MGGSTMAIPDPAANCWTGWAGNEDDPVCLILVPVFFSGLLCTHFAFSSERPMLAFALVYAGEVLLLFLLERYIPYGRRWLLPEGETANDIAHTALTKGLVQIMALLAVVFPMFAATVL